MSSLIYAEIRTGPDGPVVADKSQNADILAPLERDGFTVFADARIDDRDATLATLGLDGSVSDAEIILAAYRKWGTECADRLHGDFAFAIMDPGANRIFCARDWIGTRPFYFTHSGDRLIIGNDLAFLLGQHPELAAIDETVAATSLVGAHPMTARRTLYSAIDRLPFAHWMTVRNGALTVKQYWRPDDIAERNNVEDSAIIAEGRALMDVVVADRMRDGGKLATHISGGLDSSSVAATVTRMSRAKGMEDPPAYTWYRDPSARDKGGEGSWIEAVNDALGLELFNPLPTKEGLCYLLRQDTGTQIDFGTLIHEKPIMDHAAKRGVQTMFSGWGGDQAISFNGKGRRGSLLLSGRLGELARLGGGGKSGLVAGLRRALSELRPAMPSKSWAKKIESAYLSDTARKQVAEAPPIISPSGGAKAMMRALIHSSGLTDRMEAWAQAARPLGITYVYPLLDRRIVEFALSLPDHFFVRPGARRWIFRQILDPMIPDLVRHNDSKDEPDRIAALRPALHGALVECADLIDRNRDTVERRHLVDVEKLIRVLRADEEKAIKKLFGKRAALQLLKF